MPESSKQHPRGYRAHGLIDWRAGGIRHANPTTYQARVDGPPLLFMTDIRMSILVTLALSLVPYRPRDLKRALRVSNIDPCVTALVSSGLIASWYGKCGARYLSLDPCHPCYDGLIILLRRIGQRYGFPQPLYLSDSLLAGAAPKRVSRKRDTRMLFGSPMRTLVLLAVFKLGRASINQIHRALGLSDAKTVATTLFRYAAFGLLKVDEIGGSSGIFFEVNPDFEFATDVRSILEQVARVLVVWTLKIERYDSNGRPKTGRHLKCDRPMNSRDQAFRRWSKTSLLPQETFGRVS